MAAGGNQSKLNGWRDQAGRLAQKHTAVPSLPRLAAAPVRRRPPPKAAPSPIEPLEDIRRAEPPSARANRDKAAQAEANNFSREKADFSREKALDWITQARKEALAIRADRAKAAEARITELEHSLEAALARVTYLGDENQSLQASLEMLADENLDLARQLEESEIRSDDARSELQTSAVMWSEHSIAASAAERKLELQQSLIESKDARIQKLEQARAKLEQDSDRLLETIRERDRALAEAEKRILELTALFEKVELRVGAAKEQTGASQTVAAPAAPVLHSAPRKSEPYGADQRKPGPIKPEPRKPNPHKTDLHKSDCEDADGAMPEIRQWRRQLDTDDWLLDGPVRQ